MYERSAIPTAELTRFFRATREDKPCQTCGGKNFQIFDEQTQGRRVAFLAFAFPGFEINGSQGIDVIFTACQSCAAVTPLSRQVVTTWLAANRTQ